MSNKHQITFLYDYVFPNYFLPNGTPIDLMLLNYVHSQHNIVKDRTSFVMRNMEDVKIFYNNKKPTWPQSTDGSCILHPCFHEIFELKQDAILNNSQYHKYIYPIKLGPHAADFAAHNNLEYPKANGDYFYKFISEQALTDIRNGKALILLDYCLENFISKQEYENIHIGIQLSRLPKESIVLILNSFNGKELYESWFEPHDRCLRVENVPFLMYASSFFYDINPSRSVSTEKILESKDRIRPDYFLLKAKRPRRHRQLLITYLKMKGLLDKGNWSYIDGKLPESTRPCIKEKYDIDIPDNIISELNDILPKTLRFEEAETSETVSAWTDQHLEIYLDSYFYICTETYTGYESRSNGYDHICLTEKIFKPIANMLPFVFCAYPGALAQLRSLGFKTFDGYIDESYDNETDHCKRMHMLLAEIEKLCSMPKEELHDWYWKQYDTLLYNKEHLNKIWHEMPKQDNIVKILTGKE